MLFIEKHYFHLKMPAPTFFPAAPAEHKGRVGVESVSDNFDNIGGSAYRCNRSAPHVDLRAVFGLNFNSIIVPQLTLECYSIRKYTTRKSDWPP